MNKIQRLIKLTVRAGKKNLPLVLTICELAGLTGTTVLALKKGPEAEAERMAALGEKKEKLRSKAIQENEDTIIDLSQVKLTPWEAFKATAPVLWPVGLAFVGTGTAIIFHHKVELKRYAAMATAIGLSESALREYKAKAKEVLGPSKEKKIQEGIAADKALAAPENEDNVVCTTHGSYLFYEPLSNTYFRSSITAVERAFARANSRIHSAGYDYQQTVFDLLCELDIPPKDSYVTDQLIWLYDPDDSFGDKNYDLTFSLDYQGTPWGEPCGVIEYSIRPMWIR